MHIIECLTRGNYLTNGIAFVRRHQKTLFHTNNTIIWNATGAKGAVANWHIIQTFPANVVTVFGSTQPFGDGYGFPILKRGVASAINLKEYQSFFEVKVERIAAKGVDQGRRLTIRNLILQNPSGKGSTLIIPHFPGGRQKAVDDWFVQIASQLAVSGIQKIIFKGDGTVVIPDWFKDLCKQLGIEIVILKPEDFDRQFPDEPVEDNTPYKRGGHD
jgi:hypothetical protein